jgi:hypothetical protein
MYKINEKFGFINAEGIRIGDLIIGSKGKFKKTHFKSMSGRDIFFDQSIIVKGDIVLTGADCAENFDVIENDRIEPGTVLVIGDDGNLLPSEKPYDKRVAGVVSGGEDYHPGIILDGEPSNKTRLPIALTGKTYCKVNVYESSIEVGDLLTTSSLRGYAMKAEDPSRAFGAVIGKALRQLKEGKGIIPILVSLQ